MKWACLSFIITLFVSSANASDTIYSFRFRTDVTIIIDQSLISKKRPTHIIIYALPNGNTTAQTMGKKMQDGDDWHFDIQHIKAQTKFVRQTDTNTNYIVAYLENDLKAWTNWTAKYAGQHLTKQVIDTITSVIGIKKAGIHLNSHSGGGAFIFDLIKQEQKLSKKIKRLTFIDSDYRYDSTYTDALVNFLKRSSSSQLTVFAYNDSIALLNGKPFVSPTGGTWYRTKLMVSHLASHIQLNHEQEGQMTTYTSTLKGKINIYLLDNPERAILHTKQVELNGFIHSVFVNTRFENKGYTYFGKRAYDELIE